MIPDGDELIKARISEAVSQLRANRSDLHLFLQSLESRGEVAIVGGACRDWAVGASPRDLDIVVDYSDPCLQEAVRAKTTSWSVNRFGGIKVDMDGLQLDVWALRTSWPYRRYPWPIPNASLKHFPMTTFYNIDAVAYRLNDGELFENGFVQGMRSKRLSLIFADNPFPALCLARAAVLIKKYQLSLDESLIDFFCETVLGQLSVLDLKEALLSHYGPTVSLEEVLSALPGALTQRLER